MPSFDHVWIAMNEAGCSPQLVRAVMGRLAALNQAKHVFNRVGAKYVRGEISEAAMESARERYRQALRETLS